MGYIGNKGSISVSMSIYQTNFCFICTHLTSGERDIDIVKRNADVDEIYKRTRFNSLSNAAVPRSIKDHKKVQDLDMWLIIWLGDLNYRFNLIKPGVAFDGSTEGALNFPPTYKYEPNSDKYYGEDPRVERRTPAWCDLYFHMGRGCGN
ncbi:putative inositol-polyphosphate 5-phosphatase [Helianthus annuus]|uniref:Inositol-polyphosphate 5-phosphatase n=1 Tax=Helianthus annuus TaxID=4232 RepID=A0A251S9A3_HELAN|nr:putative inositol-polyphosphate 5-phosphatase [Helianthus annuus]KAJ0451149.1 putative inositol-polyphosphate 5-phosphatase [Helianthus annuus]KAJ0473020.1 putative inositol-polyphosphate 5-phosphatase [Helianthus annuus]KAJ0648623.1 putative inositol-polyphosphate 5-phosphatase [Helianthus annuus]KAJ0831217.1 putative inositol-polyphosphate 5-phosphatase [Helianthus annuus]